MGGRLMLVRQEHYAETLITVLPPPWINAATGGVMILSD